MSAMIEIYYALPADQSREVGISDEVKRYGGRLSFREKGSELAASICLTYEFPRWDKATAAVEALRDSGFHVEGPMDYGE